MLFRPRIDATGYFFLFFLILTILYIYFPNRGKELYFSNFVFFRSILSEKLFWWRHKVTCKNSAYGNHLQILEYLISSSGRTEIERLPSMWWRFRGTILIPKPQRILFLFFNYKRIHHMYTLRGIKPKQANKLHVNWKLQILH